VPSPLTVYYVAIGGYSKNLLNPMMLQETNFTLKKDYHPGTVGRIVELHATYYGTHWGFGAFFEAKIASDLAEFVMRYDPSRDLLLTAWNNQEFVGSIAIDGIEYDEKGAHLRWFIVAENCTGKGIGKKLLSQAMSFCKTKGYKKVYLWSFKGLNAARHLYENAGFKLVREHLGKQWGKVVMEQLFEWREGASQ